MIQFLDPKGVKFTPSYFTSPSKDITKALLIEFRKFLKASEKQMYIRQTEDPKIGETYIQDNQDKISLAHLKEHATEKMTALLEISEEEGMTEDEILKLALDSSYEPEAVGRGTSYNSLLRVPVGAYSVDLNEIKGKINTKSYDSLFKGFVSLLSPEQVQSGLQSSYAEEDGTIYLEAPHDFWEIAVDEDLYKENLIKKLGAVEKEFVEENPAVAFLT